ncbi:MAG: response regulator transcription factor [Dehalogenimonas sp.]
MQVLVIDGDPESTEIIGSTLKIPWPDVSVVPCSSGEEGLDLAERERFDLVVADLKLPDMSGFDFLKRLVLFSMVPIVAVKNDLNEVDLVRCLDFGADECLTKPIKQIEFIARTKALLRRVRGRAESQSLVSGLLRLDAFIHRAYFMGREVPLTRAENIILQHLMRNCGQVTSYRSIARELWGEDYPGSSKAIRVYVDRLRAKLESDARSPMLVNERGIGFRLISPS